MVGHNDVDWILPKKDQRLFDSGRAEHGMARMLQDELAKIKSRAFVVNREN
jgi:hypothetical protein